MEFTACEVELMPEGALTSFTLCDAHGPGIVNDVKSRTRIEYLLPTSNIIVLDLYFNF